jgi:hypothetical protein
MRLLIFCRGKSAALSFLGCPARRANQHSAEKFILRVNR